MRLNHPKAFLILILSAAISACQTGPSDTAAIEPDVAVQDAVQDAEQTKQAALEQRRLQAENLEAEEAWNEAAQAWQNLAEESAQPVPWTSGLPMRWPASQ